MLRMPDCPRTGSTQAALLDLLAFLRQQTYSFTTITPASHARVLSRTDRGETLRDGFGWSRWCPISLLPPLLFETLRAQELLTVTGDAWRSHIRVSSLDGLRLLHSAYPTVAADSVFFGPDTYRFLSGIKRWVQQHRPVARVADLGCGSGAAGLWIANVWNQTHVSLTDINERALAMTAVNAAHAGLANVHILHSDLMGSLSGQFDLIVANPPYMADPLKRNYRDGGGAHGCDLALRIIRDAYERLTPGGTLLLYTGAPVIGGSNVLIDEAHSFLRNLAGAWSVEELDPDVFGEELDTQAYATADRITALLLTLRKSAE